LRVTWLGHSTLLIELDGLRLLTDPMWSERASPSQHIGPRRFHPPPVALADLGPLDAVLLSHDHYDHLDLGTIRALSERVPLFLAPLGLGAHLEAFGVPREHIREHDWWEETALEGVRFIATPAQHFSGRGLFDRNRTLWTSWTVLGPAHRVFFSGDTGLAPEFPEIASRFGPFDVVMLEVGAFHPAWGDIHLGPDNALIAFEQLGGAALLPIHWSTFELALHPWQEPAEVLFEKAQAKGLVVLTPRIGQAFEPAVAPPTLPWWRALSPSQ
jgi:L-ascorbate metabolism protein UlaG (beta-lactamase superfamily)